MVKKLVPKWAVYRVRYRVRKKQSYINTTQQQKMNNKLPYLWAFLMAEAKVALTVHGLGYWKAGNECKGRSYKHTRHMNKYTNGAQSSYLI